MIRLNPEKLSVEFRNEVNTDDSIKERHYTLTHSDLTAQLFLTIGLEYAYDKVNPMRDEVLSEWVKQNNDYIFNVYLYVDGQANQDPGIVYIRNKIFRQELSLALEAIRYGDRKFFDEHPELDEAPIIVHFNSDISYFNRAEKWGTFLNYKYRHNGEEESAVASYYRINPVRSYIRLLHASPSAPSVDVYANGNLIAKHIEYKQLSDYIGLSDENYNIQMYPTGQQVNSIINSNISIQPGTVYNLVLIGQVPDVKLMQIQEPPTSQKFGRPCIRLAHLSPNTPDVDIILQDATRVFEGIGYTQLTDYACMPAGTYTIRVKTTEGRQNILTMPNVKLEPNTYYTLYTVGLVNKAPRFGALLVTEPRT